MRIILIILIVLLCFSCKDNTIQKFDWMLGSWVRTNEDANKSTFEYWSKKSSEEYIGLGCTVKNGDTIFKENMRIIKIDEKWSFEVTGVNENSTVFLITDLTENGFVSENEMNEFPKKITYYLDGEVLIAKISDKDTEIPFLFKKYN
ncbi:DUF6265 family protein [Lutibacter sp. B1]|uniref:DUF6265 family protein n=1 Tax=Lutibacter sp. B1 TaxID=2725996 RepID=UPI00145671F6|nr:DUF6265 family protein [Lutibacter sp. B1]NLP57584.1 hypothetical protein [Lutibacter sp. B1]